MSHEKKYLDLKQIGGYTLKYPSENPVLCDAPTRYMGVVY